jgi:hypothetical protein
VVDAAEPTFAVVIRSYNRPVQLVRLLRQIAVQMPLNTSLYVFDDASSVSMSDPGGVCRAMGGTWVRSSRNHGKRNAWKMFNTIFQRLRRDTRWTHAVFLDDDMGLCASFFERVWRRWRGIDSEHKATMTLMVDSGRGRGPCWTMVKPERVSGDAWRTHWVDGAFLCARSALETVGWELSPIPVRRWKRSSTLSTGVGKQLSGRLVVAGKGLYQVERSLVVHGFGPSHMNPEERAREPLESVDFVDGPAAAARLTANGAIVASLASIPSRVRQLEQVVEALLPQVETLCVYLNGHEQAPAFLERPGIIVERSQRSGDRGDAGKFFWSAEPLGYCLVCDDDLAYPEDYAYRMVAAIERYGRRAVVGVHGITLDAKVASYFTSRRVKHFAQRLDTDCPVHLLGTGTVGYHPSTLQVSPSDFERPNMADIWFGLLCQRQGVPRVAIARQASWLSPIKTGGPSIYDRTKRDPQHVTAALQRGVPWKLIAPERA